MNHLLLEQVQGRINQTDKFDEMRIIRDQVHEMILKHLLLSHSMELHKTINQIHDAMIARVIELSEQQMVDEGLGKPPLKYAFLLFGSGGRCEQTLWSDQDNGFIYEDSTDHSEQEVQKYFERLVSKILDGLKILGYPPCQGGVVSSNPQWRKSLSDYKSMLSGWFEEPVWEHVRYLLILADVRGIYGDEPLVREIHQFFKDYIQRRPQILKFMLSNTLHHKVHLGVFGQIITERYGEDAGGLDIKYGAYIPLVNGIRLVALKAGILASSTIERIELLIEGGHIDSEHGTAWKEAFSIALKFRDLTPFQMEDGLYITRGKLTAEQLTKETKRQLKYCLRAGTELQKLVRKTIEYDIEKK